MHLQAKPVFFGTYFVRDPFNLCAKTVKPFVQNYFVSCSILLANKNSIILQDRLMSS